LNSYYLIDSKSYYLIKREGMLQSRKTPRSQLKGAYQFTHAAVVAQSGHSPNSSFATALEATLRQSPTKRKRAIKERPCSGRGAGRVQLDCSGSGLPFACVFAMARAQAMLSKIFLKNYPRWARSKPRNGAAAADAPPFDEQRRAY
jgi:hypothetical protein